MIIQTKSIVILSMLAVMLLAAAGISAQTLQTGIAPDEPLASLDELENPIFMPIHLHHAMRPELELVGKFGGSGVWDVQVMGDYAYATAGEDGLLVLDVSDRSDPKVIATCDTPDGAFHVEAVGHYAYITDWGMTGDLRVIDISDPYDPIEVGVYEDTLTNGKPWDLAVAGNYVYLFDNDSGGPTGLHIIDVSDPTNPVEVGFFEEPFWGNAYDIDVAGNYVYYTSQSAALHIIDVSDPTNPIEAGALPAPVGGAISVAVEGDYAYLGTSDFPVVDISDPANPTVVAHFEEAGWTGSTYDVEIAGHHAYLATQHGLQVIDISNPLSPRKGSFFKISNADTAAIDGNYVYAGSLTNGITIFRILH